MIATAKKNLLMARRQTIIAINDKVGGSKDIESLFSIEEIQSDFPNYEIIELKEKEIELNEGLFHNGKGSVIRFIGKKK